MISATPALSSAPSSVSPLVVTTSWPALAASSGIAGWIEPSPGARKGDHAAVVVAVDDRLDPRAGSLGTGVDVRDQADGRARVIGARGGERRHHISVGVELGIPEAGGV